MQWLRHRATFSSGLSLAAHLLLLLVLSFIVLAEGQPPEAISTRVTEADAEELEFGDGTIDFADHPLKLPVNIEDPAHRRIAMPLPPIEPPVPDFPVDKADAPAGAAGQGNGDGDGHGLRKKSSNAVSKGNFTVWTVPEDPDAGQDYIIVIEIKLPENVERYPLKDLSGLVVGTDNWKQPIPGKNQGFGTVVDHKTQLEIKVPGAPRLVQDTIDIRSRMLKERQVLSIVF